MSPPPVERAEAQQVTASRLMFTGEADHRMEGCYFAQSCGKHPSAWRRICSHDNHGEAAQSDDDARGERPVMHLGREIIEASLRCL